MGGCNLSTQDAEAKECLQYVRNQNSKRLAKNKTNKNPGF